MLIEGINGYVSYTEDGEFELLHLDEDLIKITHNNLNLNSDTLKLIRHTWFLLSRKRKRLDPDKEYTFPERDSVLKEILNLNEEDILPDKFRIFLFEGNNEKYYWNLLLKYDWFYDYYIANYP